MKGFFFCFTVCYFALISRCRRQQSPSSHPPLLYEALTTRSSSYPTYILLKSHPIPFVIQHSELGNSIYEALVSSNRAVPVPPLVNDVADALSWILAEAPLPIRCSYPVVAISLYHVCVITDTHIHPFQAHFELTMIAMSCVLRSFLASQYDGAILLVKSFLSNRWGHRISLVPFKELLLESFEYITEVCITYFLL